MQMILYHTSNNSTADAVRQFVFAVSYVQSSNFSHVLHCSEANPAPSHSVSCKEAQLTLFQGHRLTFCDSVLICNCPTKQGRTQIVLFSVPRHTLSAVICVAILTGGLTGIIGSDVYALHTAALRTLMLIPAYLDTATKDILYPSFINTAPMFHSAL